MSTVIESQAPATTVVQNDAAAITPPAASPSIVAKLLIDMESKRKAWEAGAYRTSNLELYAMLAECLAYGGELPTSQSKQRNAELAVFCTARGYSLKKESPLMTRIVKAVFGNVARQRISTYSLVLRSAKAANVSPSNLAAWIEEKGGIQAVKLERSATYVSPKQKAEKAQQTLADSTALAVVKSDALTLLADGDFVGDECLLIAEQQADGSFLVKALSRNSTALTAALGSVYAQQIKAAEGK